MKRIRLMIVMMVMMTAVSAQAQKFSYNGKHEVAVSYGWVSNSNILDVFEDAITGMGGATYDNESFTGPIAIEYFYRTSPVVAVGGIFAYGNLKEDLYFDKDHKIKDGVTKNNYLTVMPSVKFDWLRSKNFGMYSKLAAGVTLRNEKIDYVNGKEDNYNETAWHFNWQASLIGAEVGGENIRAFAEIGIGEQGVLLVGVRTRF